MEVSPLIQYLIYQLYGARQSARHITLQGDPETLHKLRVSLRRTRSLMSLYLPECYAICDILKSIVRQTNEIRELDVLMSELNAAEYPEVYGKLQRCREELFKTHLSKKALTHISAKLDRLYNELLDIRVTFSDDELRQKAREHYKQIIRRYNTLKGDEPDKEMHQLRIQFKIARYAFDFLTQCDIKNEKNRSMKCEDIQDHLGAIQDAANQIEWLKKFYDANPSKECKRLLKSRKKRLSVLKEITASNRPA